MTRLVGIAGRARSGKDTAAQLFVDAGFVRYAFADPIRAGLKVMLGLSDAFFDDDLKEKEIAWLGCSPRYLMQTLGTEWGREMIGANVWCLYAQRVFEDICQIGTGGMVISDVRFETEARWIRDNGGLLIHLYRHDAPPVAEHVSEAGIEVKAGDVVIGNNGTLEELHAKLGDVMAGMDERYRNAS